MSLPPIPKELLTSRLISSVGFYLATNQSPYIGLGQDASVLMDAVRERVTPRVLTAFRERRNMLYQQAEPIQDGEGWGSGPKTRSPQETAWRAFERQALLQTMATFSNRSFTGINVFNLWVEFSTPANTLDGPYSHIANIFDRFVFYNMLHKHLPDPPTDSEIDLWLVS